MNTRTIIIAHYCMSIGILLIALCMLLDVKELKKESRDTNDIVRQCAEWIIPDALEYETPEDYRLGDIHRNQGIKGY